MADIGKWKIGPSCTSSLSGNLQNLTRVEDGPVLTQTELYLLKINVELHPMLRKEHSSQLIFNIATGELRSG